MKILFESARVKYRTYSAQLGIILRMGLCRLTISVITLTIGHQTQFDIETSGCSLEYEYDLSSTPKITVCIIIQCFFPFFSMQIVNKDYTINVFKHINWYFNTYLKSVRISKGCGFITRGERRNSLSTLIQFVWSFVILV